MKFTREEKNWILYDIGNSAFTMLMTTIMPIYFNYLAESGGLTEVEYMAYWGYAASIATLVVAVLGPVCGSIADNKGFKKTVFLTALAVGALGCVSLGFAKQWLVFLVILIIAKIGYSSSLIFYDAMLTDVTTEEKMDQVSSLGYALGYIGSCIPFVACLVIVLGADMFGLTMQSAMTIAFLITATWWVLMSLPLMKTYEQKYYVERQSKVVSESFKRLGRTLMNVRKEKKTFLFLLAFFFYIDGVYTIIDMATAYGSALGLDSTGLLIALLVTQIVAFPFAIIFGRLAQKYSTDKLISVCIVAYFGIAVFAYFLSNQVQFFALAVLVGMFQGGIQALSRSYFTKIIPAEKAGEYFGLMDICGKGASFLGTAVVSGVSQLTGSLNKGVGVIALFFVAGIILFRMSVKAENDYEVK
ncbi:MAG: MFS transporter [Lachnospiraceae bacterium]|nr:MFS transporter [Lachnospiraceae bacterium]